MTSTFSWREIRQLVHSCPPGPERVDLIDELLDILADDIHELYPAAPDGVGWAAALAQVRMAMQLPAPPDDDDSGGGGGGRPRKPAPMPAPEAMMA